MSCSGGNYENDRQYKNGSQGDRNTGSDDTCHLSGGRFHPDTVHRFNGLDLIETKRAHVDHAGPKHLDLKFLAAGRADPAAEPVGLLLSRKPNLNERAFRNRVRRRFQSWAGLDRFGSQLFHQLQRLDLAERNAAGFADGVLNDQGKGLIVERTHPPAELIRPLLSGETDLNGRVLGWKQYQTGRAA